MKIAYGTYAMPTVPLEEAFPMLAGIGYDGVEVCISDKHHGATPDQMDADRRANLRGLLEQQGLGVPALFLLGSVYTPDDQAHRANLERVRLCAQLARDLGMREPPVLAMGFGGKRDDWDAIRPRMVQLLGDYADLAEQEDFILAGEAHCGAAVYNSERIVSLLSEVNDPRVRLHFDIVHLFLAGEPIEQAVATLVPWTAHTHITDAIRHDDGSFQLVLLGDGDLDAVAYMRAMKQAGWTDFITLEVSTMVWAKEDYDVRAAARKSYDALAAAFEAAGVERP
ncbi:MAG TPA: sugar phosphate isomerase/epimerase family protein [Armatimonadota bacterium]|nr:sugar phosphate isomerase/epimerase family protein [Armatimonadota bacterium]